MDEANIRKYANLMRELELTGLEITEGGTVVRLERGGVPASPVQAVPLPEAKAAAGGSVIRSPMVGVFYAAPAENAAPYVAVGDRVKAGDTLCIIEAMKLMNEVVAEWDGEIVEVCVENGARVDYGCELFRMRRTD